MKALGKELLFYRVDGRDYENPASHSNRAHLHRFRVRRVEVEVNLVVSRRGFLGADGCHWADVDETRLRFVSFQDTCFERGEILDPAHITAPVYAGRRGGQVCACWMHQGDLEDGRARRSDGPSMTRCPGLCRKATTLSFLGGAKRRVLFSFLDRPSVPPTERRQRLRLVVVSF